MSRVLKPIIMHNIKICILCITMTADQVSGKKASKCQYQIWRKAIGAHVQRMNQNSVYINQWNFYNIGYYKKNLLIF